MMMKQSRGSILHSCDWKRGFGIEVFSLCELSSQNMGGMLRVTARATSTDENNHDDDAAEEEERAARDGEEDDRERPDRPHRPRGPRPTRSPPRTRAA